MIKVENLEFSYTKKPFIKDINFEVKKGEIFGFLGPSGAGKSTLQKILTGLITNYSGSAIVNHTESKNHDDRFYENIGLDFEFPSLYEKLTARQNLKFFGSLYNKKLRDTEELFHKVGLGYDMDKKVFEYSKGMKSRLNFIKALLHDPDILFLDEPTSGLDPSNSRDMKNIILEEKHKGKTIILTTHNMNDAAELCDRVAFIVDGRVKALDTPHNLIMSKGATKLKYSYYDKKEIIRQCPLNKTVEDSKLLDLIQQNKLLSIHSSEPTLNDIFIEVTGRGLQ
ncbi:ABC transporter ATP-binding protein [Mobilitalea sibirica]|uniref:ABC transporter ATP-binding protein n=1 Tax=Mobilitalea sibirica TaxID=1462919 RepID=A0A8J7H6B3_9FIRM|nr:ABC transporter ATP-binding protein [Mobilitalea sibirica]MBH1942329.1 ABC transporter ATP-binding protein [Mobilitalea sibirica]